MLKDYVALAFFGWTVLWSVGSVVAHWAIARSRATKVELAAIRSEMELKAEQMRVDGHEKKLIEHDRRVQELEHDVKSLPTLTVVHELSLAMAEIRGDLRTMSATLKTNTEMTRRIDDHLFAGGKS